MISLTFEQYQANGGKADDSAFPLLARLAEKKLDYWTMGRIREADDDIRLCLTLIINALAEIRENQTESVSGFSNDGVSVNFSKLKRAESEIMESVYGQIVEILPVELVSAVIQ